ncbi:helix-turn-helix domain-containing protein [Streptomyces pseudovenezuelae]|uniref:helix-turn-helix domain-containing protein n=1 Tax=Streptomyces pseudovenezuelae TaxID=67350 RepID=UPI0039A64149
MRGWHPRHNRRGRGRPRAVGAGPNHQLVFTDRIIATLIALRFQLPHTALAVLYAVDRSTITRAVHEIRPLLAARGFAVPGHQTCGFAPVRPGGRVEIAGRTSGDRWRARLRRLPMHLPRVRRNLCGTPGCAEHVESHLRGGQILDAEADELADGDLLVVLPAGCRSGEDLTEFRVDPAALFRKP